MSAEVLEEETWISPYKRKLLESEARAQKLNPLKRKRIHGDEEQEQEVPRKRNTKEPVPVQRPTKSLVDQKVEMLKNGTTTTLTPTQEVLKQEQELLNSIVKVDKPLMSVAELANDISYKEPMPSNWRPARFIETMTEEERARIIKEFHIILEGNTIPNPCTRFKDMKLPRSLTYALKKKGIKRPTPIQVQGLPVVLSGRDMIGIAFTGSGKTIVFSLPMVLVALQEELKLPIGQGEGPIGLIICPSRELAKQTFEVVEELAEALHKDGYPRLKTLLCIGGIPMRDQAIEAKRGVHMIIATPGRLVDMLDHNKFTLTNCKYLAMDEADRLIDQAFEEEIRHIVDFFKFQRQTLLFSATMPTKIKNFAKSALVDPIIVNVGRAGAANLDVVQEVEHVKQEAKIVYLLECLQKTAPPVLVFCENKRDVDDIYEYLLLKGVEAASIHGDKDQLERTEAIQEFKKGRKDVLVATDIASKGLDFPDVKHVINYDMPKTIEDYVHRIGRTGRCGKTGLATTFINKNQSQAILLDLKYLLMEAKQRIPPVLKMLDGENNTDSCPLCNGLGHKVADCPKFQQQQRMPRTNDYLRD